MLVTRQKCQACKGLSINAYLCGKCTKALRADLADWPWWLNRLIETAVGQARLGDGGRRSARTMHGDDSIGSHIERLPGCRCDTRLRDTVEHDFIGPLMPGWRRLGVDEAPECDCDPLIARRRRERAALAHALALGRVNASASELHDDARNTMGSWVRHLCESRGVEPPELATAVRMARWLRANVRAIANDEAAGEFVDELADLRKRIERAVNRPQPRKFLGACPTWDEETGKACGRELYAPDDAIEVWCRACHQTHNCNRLQLLLHADLERAKFTAEEIIWLNRTLPVEYQVHRTTLWRWRQPGHNGEPPKLTPHGCNDDGAPLYRWTDVRRLAGGDIDTPPARTGRRRKSSATMQPKSAMA